MDLIVFIAVLFSAMVQASWNFFTKKSKADRASILAVGWLMFGCGLLVTFPWTVSFSQYESVWLKYSIASGIVHAFYIFLLGWGYSVGEISIVYPISRGLGILWTALATFLFGFHSFSIRGISGIACIIAGVLLIGYKAISSKSQKHPFLIAIAISLTILLYSLIDSKAAKEVPIVFYITVVNIIAAGLVIPYLFKFSRMKILHVLRQHKSESLMIGTASLSAYMIILWAFQYTSASYVVALREISVVFASILGFIFLKEEISKRKLMGILLITLGAIFLKWS